MFDTSICQSHGGGAVNGANQIVGDVVCKYVRKPVEGIVDVMRICECNDDGVVDSMLLHQLLCELGGLEARLAHC